MAALDDDPVKKSLLRSIIKGNANKVAEILKNNANLSADESLDSAQNRLLHKAARYGIPILCASQSQFSTRFAFPIVTL